MTTKSKRVLLVEDEPMIRFLIGDMLTELGHRIAAEASNLGQAQLLAGTVDFDFAILDVNLNGHIVTPVAEVIRARDLPFIFATGYGAEGVPPAFRDQTSLQKPFQIDALSAVIDLVCNS